MVPAKLLLNWHASKGKCVKNKHDSSNTATMNVRIQKQGYESFAINDRVFVRWRIEIGLDLREHHVSKSLRGWYDVVVVKSIALLR